MGNKNHLVAIRIWLKTENVAIHSQVMEAKQRFHNIERKDHHGDMVWG